MLLDKNIHFTYKWGFTALTVLVVCFKSSNNGNISRENYFLQAMSPNCAI